MDAIKVTVSATINADAKKVWDFYTNPKHITQWNFAHPSWCCPSATNDLKVGGRYVARMEAKDGSFGFDFDATYTEVNMGKSFTYVSPDKDARVIEVSFAENDGKTDVTIVFDAEKINAVELQKSGWQAILDNFKLYTETN